MRYNIFAGLGGGYGGAVWTRTVECLNYDDAMREAYMDACECWESYGGLEAIEGYTWEDMVEDYGEDATDELYSEMDVEAMDGWVDYNVEEVPADAPADYEYDGDLK